MSFLDRVGKKAMDAIEAATRAAEEARTRVAPLIEKTPLSSLFDKATDDIVVPDPEPNLSPFGSNEPIDDTPLGDPARPAEIFGAGTDPWTGRSVQLLADHQIDHVFTDLEDPSHQKLEPRLIRQTKQSSPPFVFLRGEFIGGYNALHEIQRLGQLEVRTTPASEREEGNRRVRIVIPARTENDSPEGERGLPDDRQ